MRKWSRGLSDWPLTERRGDTYGGQPSVAVDLHGHTAIKNSRSRPDGWPFTGAATSSRVAAAAPQPPVEALPVQDGTFAPDAVRADLQDPVRGLPRWAAAAGPSCRCRCPRSRRTAWPSWSWSLLVSISPSRYRPFLPTSSTGRSLPRRWSSSYGTQAHTISPGSGLPSGCGAYRMAAVPGSPRDRPGSAGRPWYGRRSLAGRAWRTCCRPLAPAAPGPELLQDPDGRPDGVGQGAEVHRPWGKQYRRAGTGRRFACMDAVRMPARTWETGGSKCAVRPQGAFGASWRRPRECQQ